MKIDVDSTSIMRCFRLDSEAVAGRQGVHKNTIYDIAPVQKLATARLPLLGLHRLSTTEVAIRVYPKIHYIT